MVEEDESKSSLLELFISTSSSSDLESQSSAIEIEILTEEHSYQNSLNTDISQHSLTDKTSMSAYISQPSDANDTETQNSTARCISTPNNFASTILGISGTQARNIDNALKKIVNVLTQSSSLLVKLTFTVKRHVPKESAASINQAKSMLIDMVSESALFAVDRLRSFTDVYIHPHVTTDDPEAQHILWLVSHYLVCDSASLDGEVHSEPQTVVCSVKYNDGSYKPSLESFSLRQLRLLSLSPPGYESRVNGVTSGLTRSAGSSLEIAETEPQSRVLKTRAPRFKMNTCCFLCSRPFTVSLFRHHCRRCGESFCSDHSPQRRRLPQLGFAASVRTCTSCAHAVDVRTHTDQLWWRAARVTHFLRGQLVPYANPTVDRKIDKALRLVDGTLHVVKKTISLDYPSKMVIETIMALKRYGLSGLAGVLMREDFFEAVETLKRISGMDKMFAMSLHELTACIYYKLAIDRGLRGCDPDAEHAQAETSKLETSTERLQLHLDEAIRFAPLALDAIYKEVDVECQHIAQCQGWTSIFIHTDSAPEQPAYAVFASSSSSVSDATERYHQQASQSQDGFSGLGRKVAVLAIRGTVSVHDVVTDIRAAPHRFPPPASVVSEALGGRYHPEEEDDAQNAPVNGRRVDLSDSNDVSQVSQQDARRRVGSGDVSEVASVEHTSSEGMKSTDEDFFTVKLSQWEWTSEMSDMRYACKGMARSALWLLRQVGPSLLQLHEEGYEIVLTGHSLGAAVAVLMTALLQQTMPAVRAVVYGCPSCVDAYTADSLKDRVLSVVVHDDVVSRVTPRSLRNLLKELMWFRRDVFRYVREDWRDVIARAVSLWAPRLRQSSSSSAVNGHAKVACLSSMYAAANDVTPTPSILLDGNFFSMASLSPMDSISGLSAPAKSTQEQIDSSLVIVDDEAVPELWLPGTLLHVYSYRGQYRATVVSRDYANFRRIEVQGNMFSDHATADIFDALLETRAVNTLNATKGYFPSPPVWTKYDSVTCCECCHNPFTWHSTFRGEAQEYRERYNCRQCGKLVCGPCSEKRRPVPRLGLIFPSRVCDGCYYKGEIV